MKIFVKVVRCPDGSAARTCNAYAEGLDSAYKKLEFDLRKEFAKTAKEIVHEIYLFLREHGISYKEAEEEMAMYIDVTSSVNIEDNTKSKSSYIIDRSFMLCEESGDELENKLKYLEEECKKGKFVYIMLNKKPEVKAVKLIGFLRQLLSGGSSADIVSPRNPRNSYVGGKVVINPEDRESLKEALFILGKEVSNDKFTAEFIFQDGIGDLLNVIDVAPGTTLGYSLAALNNIMCHASSAVQQAVERGGVEQLCSMLVEDHTLVKRNALKGLDIICGYLDGVDSLSKVKVYFPDGSPIVGYAYIDSILSKNFEPGNDRMLYSFLVALLSSEDLDTRINAISLVNKMLTATKEDKRAELIKKWEDVLDISGSLASSRHIKHSKIEQALRKFEQLTGIDLRTADTVERLKKRILFLEDELRKSRQSEEKIKLHPIVRTHSRQMLKRQLTSNRKAVEEALFETGTEASKIENLQAVIAENDILRARIDSLTVSLSEEKQLREKSQNDLSSLLSKDSGPAKRSGSDSEKEFDRHSKTGKRKKPKEKRISRQISVSSIEEKIGINFKRNSQPSIEPLKLDLLLQSSADKEKDSQKLQKEQLEKEMEQLNQEKTTLQQEIDGLKSDRMELELERSEIEGTIRILQQSVPALESQHQNALERLASLQRKSQMLNAEMTLQLQEQSQKQKEETDVKQLEESLQEKVVRLEKVIAELVREKYQMAPTT